MRNIDNYITEKLKIGKNTNQYKYYPEDKKELQELLVKLLKERGENADLNDICTENIYDMARLFQNANYKTRIHNIDISQWDVSNVMWFNSMFAGCEKLNCDLSKWDVSSGETFDSMFFGCHNFNSDLSEWNMSNAERMEQMFYECYDLDTDLSKWNVSKCDNFYETFFECFSLNFDLEPWKVNPKANMINMLCRADKLKKPSWYEED